MATCCHLCTLLLFFLLTSSQVTKELKSVVVLEGSTAVFSCAGHASDGVNVNIDNNQKDITSWPVNVSEYGAVITGYSGDGDIKILQIAIVATMSNNGTNIECQFIDDDVHDVNTGPVKLYIPSEELGSNPGFITPTVSSSPSQLTISWSPPWSHLVNEYTVTVVNKTYNKWTNHVTDKNTRSLTIDDVSVEQCSEYDMFVTASTDIGDTESSIVHTGLSKEIQSIHPDNITIVVFRALWSNELKVEVSLKAPDHCSQVQTLLYNYTVMSNGVELQCNGPSSSTESDFEGIVEIDSNYTLHVMHWESGNQAQVVTKDFTTFQQDVAVDPYLHSVLTVTAPASTISSTRSTAILDPQPTPTTQQDINTFTESDHIPIQQTSVTSITTSTSTAISGTSVSVTSTAISGTSISQVKSDWMPTITTSVIAIATCTVVIAVVAIIGCLMVVRRNKGNRRKKSSDDVFKEDTLPNGTSIEVHNMVPRERSRTLYTRPTTTRHTRKERRPSVPQMMATNPLYEGSSPIYSCLQNPSDLRSLTTLPQESPPPPLPPTGNNRGNELQLDIPPQLPLPRKQTLDSPGVKAGVLLSLDKQQLDSIPPNDTNEQYVEMTSTREQRYVKSPSNSLKRKDIIDGTAKSHDNIIMNDGNEKQD